MKTQIVIKLYNIKWDTDGEKVKLPKEAKWEPDLCDLEDYLRDGVMADYIDCNGADYLSDKYGWCVESFEWCFV